MVIGTRRNGIDGLGFTLLEMLMTVALLIALLGAVVYNFESAKRGADLEEGARQFEALIRFAGAQAANTGRMVQFRFGEDSDSVLSSTNMVDIFEDFGEAEGWGPKLRVVWEPDPVLQPGVFVDLAEAALFVETIGDRVRIEIVRTPGRPLNQSTNDLAYLEEGPVALPTVTFFPDGSSETAEIVLISKEREDFRQMTVHVDGVTGGVRSELKSPEDLVPLEWMDDENSAQPQGTAVTENANELAPMPELPDRDTTFTNDFDADFPE